MKAKIIITAVLFLLFAKTVKSQYNYEPYKSSVALQIAIVSDTGKAMDSSRSIYPCGQTKYLKAVVWAKDVLGTDSLVFTSEMPNGKKDTLAFFIARDYPDSASKKILILTDTNAVKIWFAEPWPDYKTNVKHTNSTYNATREWYVDWIIGYKQ